MQQHIDSEIVLQRFNVLPKNIRYQVFEYIEFLISRYSGKSEEEEREIPDSIKKTLQERSAYSKKYPETRLNWKQVKDEILAKNEKV